VISVRRPPDLSQEERVAGGQARVLREIRASTSNTTDLLDQAIRRAEALAASHGVAVQQPLSASVAPPELVVTRPLPTFDELLAITPPDAALEDALDAEEIRAALLRLEKAGDDTVGEGELDRWDLVIAGTAGLLAGLADIVLVGIPQNPLTQFGAEGGLLSNGIQDAVSRVLPPDLVAKLEKAFPVPYDPSTNARLLKPVDGLYPVSHRFHSLGHDPLLGWVFGVRDILSGTFSAIGRDGVLVVQGVTSGEAGQNLFSGLFDAFRRVGGHMLSDVATPMGLPAPLMPLTQFLQMGTIGSEGLSVAEITRRMYRDGYDFRHFLTGGLTTGIIEVIVRGSWMIRRLQEGRSFQQALPVANIPRLRRQLLLGHAMAAAVNAGKVAVMSNPLALNWAQWLAVLRYLGPELLHLARAPVLRAAAQDKLLDGDLRIIAGMPG
jgi:hypothetical protein